MVLWMPSVLKSGAEVSVPVKILQVSTAVEAFWRRLQNVCKS